jgi:hypothetical protein
MRNAMLKVDNFEPGHVAYRRGSDTPIDAAPAMPSSGV